MRSSRPMPCSHHRDVGADLLAHVRDLVDERDLGRQEGVGGVLDHLRRGHVGADRPAPRGRRTAPATASPSAASDAPMTIRSGCMKSATRPALAQELGVRDVARSGRGRAASSSSRTIRRFRPGRCTSSPASAARTPPASSSMTTCTRDRSASPECVGGVSTQTNTTRQRSSTSVELERERQPGAVSLEEPARRPARRSAPGRPAAPRPGPGSRRSRRRRGPGRRSRPR